MEEEGDISSLSAIVDWLEILAQELADASLAVVLAHTDEHEAEARLEELGKMYFQRSKMV